MTIYFNKSKSPILGPLGPFLPKFAQKWFFLERSDLSLQIFQLSAIVATEKTNVPFQRKMPNLLVDGQTDRRTDRKPWFCKNLFMTGVQLLKSNFELSSIKKPVYSINFFVWYNQF